MGGLVVLQSFPEPRRTTNPYLVMLRDQISATPGVVLRTFSWRSALLRRCHVFHVHWPENLLAQRSWPSTLLRHLLLAALLVKLQLTRTPIVRTLHNVSSHSTVPWWTRALLHWLEHQTSLFLLLNTSSVAPLGKPSETILHGHYRGWFESFDKPRARLGRLAYVGLIKPYKNVAALLRAFGELSGPYSLHVAGHPAPALVEPLATLAARDQRVQLTLDYLSDEELVRVVCQAELVVLPYTEMHNSGTVLLALSMDRPVLVPRNTVNERLAAEVGQPWVQLYDGEVSGRVLVDALEGARARPAGARPDLTARSWDSAGREHVAAYRRARQLLRGPRAWA